MANTRKAAHSSSKWASFNAITLLCLFVSQSLAQNDTCTVPAVFQPAILQSRATDPSFADNAQFQTQVVDDHNWYRSQHSANPLTWSDKLAKSSNDWIDKCQWGHSGTPGVGENIALGYSRVVDAVNGWALERVNYNFNSPGFASGTGHFTQIVWKRTTEVGCARKQCQIPSFSNGNPIWYLVCQYQSPGNVVNAGQFEANVGRQVSGDPKVGISGTLSPGPATKTSAPPARSAAPVANSPVKTVTASAGNELPDVVIVTVTVTQDVATNQASTSAEPSKTAAAPNPTTGPFWGKLKTSGTSDPFFHSLGRRSGTARVEVRSSMAMVGLVAAVVFTCL